MAGETTCGCGITDRNDGHREYVCVLFVNHDGPHNDGHGSEWTDDLHFQGSGSLLIARVTAERDAERARREQAEARAEAEFRRGLTAAAAHCRGRQNAHRPGSDAWLEAGKCASSVLDCGDNCLRQSALAPRASGEGQP